MQLPRITELECYYTKPPQNKKEEKRSILTELLFQRNVYPFSSCYSKVGLCTSWLEMQNHSPTLDLLKQN